MQEEQGMEIHVIGIDMSSAFDTIHREKIMTIASKFLEEDELRILRVTERYYSRSENQRCENNTIRIQYWISTR